jgi:hypothetical protein
MRNLTHLYLLFVKRGTKTVNSEQETNYKKNIKMMKGFTKCENGHY